MEKTSPDEVTESTFESQPGSAVASSHAQMPIKDLEDILEATGLEINRPVALFDQSLNLLAYSSHTTSDPIRTATIIHRKPPAEAMAIAESLSLSEAPSPVRVPASPELGSGSRVCVPVRLDDLLFGYIFVLDPEEDLDERSLNRVVESANECAINLRAAQLERDARRRATNGLVDSLLGDDPDATRKAAAAIVDNEILQNDAPIVAIVVTIEALDRGPDTQALLKIMEHARSRIGLYHAFECWRSGYGLILVDARDDDVVAELAAEIYKGVNEYLPARAVVGVGVGSVVHELTSARKTFRRALGAARLGSAFGSESPITDWNQLAAYRLLALFPDADLHQDDLPASLVRILDHEFDFAAVETLESFLDNGCSVKRTSATLGIHRATLYYRLQRLSEIGGFGLKDGEALLDLHLALKLMRLSR